MSVGAGWKAEAPEGIGGSWGGGLRRGSVGDGGWELFHCLLELVEPESGCQGDEWCVPGRGLGSKEGRASGGKRMVSEVSRRTSKVRRSIYKNIFVNLES